jgi:hypothetical protein
MGAVASVIIDLSGVETLDLLDVGDVTEAEELTSRRAIGGPRLLDPRIIESRSSELATEP